MKFIHLTDTHVTGDGTLYGQDPAARLRAAVASINGEHGDADFVVLTGDMTHWGDAAAYARFSREIKALNIPVHLMVGNHDDTAAFGAAFPEILRDKNGFVQSGFDTPFGRFLLLDTKDLESHAGAYCPARQTWLDRELDQTSGPIVLFMHHPPFKTGIAAMDQIMLRDAKTFYDIIAPHKARIRHLFFGHVHRAIFGSWRGISYSCMRGLNHQVALELNGTVDHIAANFEPPAYGVVMLTDDQVTVHLHDFADRSERFFL
ncbi:phosphodiesterase [Sulfitobacter sp. M57]|uniref:phosphodiesterase n=1 Tax=unclassified Sulfitobacter TaxID=196795 RepID=UPI0023E2FA77|nr:MULTISPECIES: phosphodiesterase [unclassified Sulfitobacter]MDF3415836.1 phosphodiesterase [Sulfitobacter sp. KE5]MDF3423316.1 phosphodiesterase [Sulfitobacter sp. KE43]MDF3434382.1 phosphodiesterase [Sulfitobacter sp. KE42]MDF3460022.1 phosphodiesterase [Sulfitobacter sp. S74]MDF3463920.1 phosphodiesterase [Sulfitobacter sp. Ks18]